MTRGGVLGGLLLAILAVGMALSVVGGLNDPPDRATRTTVARGITAGVRSSTTQTAPTGSSVPAYPPAPSPPVGSTWAAPIPTVNNMPGEPFPGAGATTSSQPVVPRRGATATSGQSGNPPADLNTAPPNTGQPDIPSTTSEPPPQPEPEPTTTTEPPTTTTTTEPPTTTTSTAVLVILGEPCPVEGARGLALGGIPCVCLPDDNGRARWVAS